MFFPLLTGLLLSLDGRRGDEGDEGRGVLHGLLEGLDLLLAQLDLVCDLPGVHDELGLHLDKVLVVLVSLLGKVFVEEPGHRHRPAVDRLLQTLGLVQLVLQLGLLVLQ